MRVAFGLIDSSCLQGNGAVDLLVGAKNVLPGIDLFSQGATPQISSALQRFTAEFEMDRSGSTTPWTPG